METMDGEEDLSRDGGDSAAVAASVFDHLLRSKESYAEKWDYVVQNPVRAGLTAAAEDWPYAGHIHFDNPLTG
jgi:hypothetical protein